MITRLAMEAKVHFAEAMDEDVEAVVEVAVEEADVRSEVSEIVEV